MIVTVLEWVAFIGSMGCSLLYGNGGYKGPISGIFVAIAFILFGIVGGVPAAIISNIFFLGIHGRNFKVVHDQDEAKAKARTVKDIGRLQEIAHKASKNAGWWDEHPATNKYVIPTKLMLMVSEIAEAMEGDRMELMDDKLPHRTMLEVELADLIIRALDLGGALGLDIGGAMAEKMQFNSVRPDHKIENRVKASGKKY